MTPAMNNQADILRELRESIADALRRTEERMSHVQRQLAGWSLPIARSVAVPEPDDNWDELQTQASQLTDEFDQALTATHSSLSEWVQYGRQVKTTVNS